MSTISNILGYILNYIYIFVNNYGLAIILFTILIKIILLPVSIKQQRTMKKTSKMQIELKEIQDKYKNNPERLNQEMINLYKRENMSPFSGCLSSIIQIVLIISIFYIVRSPLTYMKKVDTQTIENYKSQLNISKTTYPEVQIIKEMGSKDNNVYLNMNFLGLDLSSVPSADYKDYKVFIIPILYVISSIISMKITLNMQKTNNMNNNKEETSDELEALQNMNKTMGYMMPIVAVSVSLIAPLGLALYWLINNLLMILERIILNTMFKEKEE